MCLSFNWFPLALSLQMQNFSIICMYVCMHVCVYVYMYMYVCVCMYVCMDGWIDRYR